MYALQFMVFGAQTILLGGHMDALGFSGAQISYVFATGALAALVSPVLAGVLADRFFATQIIVGCCYLACAPLLVAAWAQSAFGPLWLALAASLRRLGMRRTIALGILAHAVRFGILALGEPAFLVIASQGLHGFSFTFISIGTVIAVEGFAPPDLRASAQGFFIFVNGGIGALAGHWFAGAVYDAFTAAGGAHDWTWIFLVPALVTGAALVAFLALFRDPHPHA